MPTPTTPPRFWAKVDRNPGHGPNGDCWKWTGYTIHSGQHRYGRTCIGAKVIVAHRLAWMFWHGEEAPRELEVAHRCDFGLCVRPDHLFLATHRENMQDMSRKGRHVPHDVKGEKHPMRKFTEAQVLEIRRRRAAGEQVTVLAREFGVWPSAISKIANGIRWPHLAGVAA